MIFGYYVEMFLLFLFVLLHELCHVMIARIYKLKVRSIELFPFGGVARIEELDYAGVFRSIAITAAGPLFNLASALLLFLLKMNKIYIPLQDYMIDANLVLGLFNMLPGMPLDGGRIVRSVLSCFIGYKKSVIAAAALGKIIAVTIFLCGILLLFYGKPDISLLVMPFFIFITADREENSVMFIIIRDIVNKKNRIKNRKVMETLELCVYEDTYISEILKYFDFNKFHIFFVIDRAMGIEGVITETQIFDNLSAGPGDITIGELCNNIKKQDKY